MSRGAHSAGFSPRANKLSKGRSSCSASMLYMVGRAMLDILSIVFPSDSGPLVLLAHWIEPAADDGRCFGPLQSNSGIGRPASPLNGSQRLPILPVAHDEPSHQGL